LLKKSYKGILGITEGIKKLEKKKKEMGSGGVLCFRK